MFPPVSGLLTIMKDLVSIELCDGTPLTIARLEGALLKIVAKRQGVGIEGSEVPHRFCDLQSFRKALSSITCNRFVHTCTT